jgi:hypothetical protein
MSEQAAEYMTDAERADRLKGMVERLAQQRRALRALCRCQAIEVAGLPGYVDVRIPLDVWTRAREAGE